MTGRKINVRFLHPRIFEKGEKKAAVEQQRQYKWGKINLWMEEGGMQKGGVGCGDLKGR